DVATLSFGIQSIEGQRGLTGAREPREHDQPIARQIEIDSFEIVSACSADANLLHQRSFSIKTVECTRSHNSGNAPVLRYTVTRCTPLECLHNSSRNRYGAWNQ